MIKKRSLFVGMMFVGQMLQAQDEDIQIAEGPFEPTRKSLAKSTVPEWVQDAKLGFWSHWGPQAVPGQGDWYAKHMYNPEHRHYKYHVETYGHPSKVGYKDVVQQWKAEKFTPEYADYLMKLFQDAGAKFFVAQAHHHDNFDLWDSKYHTWDSVEKGPKKNIIKIWDDSARKHDMRLGLTSHLVRSPKWMATCKNSDSKGKFEGIPYDGTNPEFADLYHPMNWNSKEYDWPRRWFKRVKDVVDQHNPDFIYVDGGIPLRNTYGYKLVAHLFNKNVARNNGKLEAFILSKTIEERDISMHDIESSVALRKLPFPWMSDHFIGDWYWQTKHEEGEILYGSSDFQIDHLIDTVSKNGVVMMNIPQRSDGSVHEKILQTLKEWGDWMKVNGEGIYATRTFQTYGEGPSIIAGDYQEILRTAPKSEWRRSRDATHRSTFKAAKVSYNEKHTRYTQSKDGNTVYAFILGWPKDQKEAYFAGLNLLDNRKITKVELLGHGDVKFGQTVNRLTVQLPEKAPFEQAVCFKVSLKK